MAACFKPSSDSAALRVSENHRNRRAFTLVELLVVIGIIALLVSVLLPALRRAREAASQAACASNMRQVGMALNGYASENRLHYPFSAGLDQNPLMRKEDWVYWEPGRPEGVQLSPLFRYMGRYEPRIMRCPSDT